MLVVGSGIVFGSSLMLVNRAWPNLDVRLQFLTILGYTAATFAMAELGGIRLGLNATYKVLHGLVLLLLPICFQSLNWLTHGSAAQGVLRAFEVVGLMIPATALLWFSSSRILDHALRGRQTTFLISYQLLCVAGIVPRSMLQGPVAAFSFMALCWLIFSSGVVKVNRHIFWLAEEHRLPRIFGFLPIAMLGLQFVALVVSRTVTLANGTPVSSIPVHWLGFGCVMVATTILLTARTVADVYRQRTGDLVRPLPLNIVIPLFSALVLTVAGVACSFSGFSYVHPNTYTVVPTAALAAVLMWLTARDTRQSGFVWVSLIFATIAYQCAPTLAADLIRQIKQGVEVAINEQRLPVAFYGLTYIPLLLSVAIASRWFTKTSESELARPLKHFVTLLSMVLLLASFTHLKAMFVVTMVYVPANIGLAIVFSDRRYILPAIGSLILATASAIPALNGMNMVDVSSSYVPAALAALAAILTMLQLPDCLLNRIPLSSGSVVRQRDETTGQLTNRSVLFHRADGSSRNLLQLSGCLLAALMAGHWAFVSVASLPEELSHASLLQYACLVSAFTLFTVRNPHYFAGLSIWLVVALASVRYAVGQNAEWIDIAGTASVITAGTSLLAYLWFRVSGQISQTITLSDLRRGLGFDSESQVLLPSTKRSGGGWTRRTQAFVVPLCDLSLVVLSSLAVVVHLPLLAKAHLPVITESTLLTGHLLPSTTVTVFWLVAATFVFRSRTSGVAAVVASPFWTTALLVQAGLITTLPWLLAALSLIYSAVLLSSRIPTADGGQHSLRKTMADISEAALQTLLLLGIAGFHLPLRLSAAVVMLAFLLADRLRLKLSTRTFLAIMGSVQAMLLAAALGGAEGPVFYLLTMKSTGLVVPFVFVTASVCILLFDHYSNRLDSAIADSWAALLRATCIPLAVLSLVGPIIPSLGQVVMVAGLMIVGGAELLRAVRQQREFQVWTSFVVGAFVAVFLTDQAIIRLGEGKSQFVLLGLSVAALIVERMCQGSLRYAVLRRPMNFVGQTLPALVAGLAVVREVTHMSTFSQAANSMALMAAAGIYFQQAITTRRRRFAMAAAAILDVSLMLLWWSFNISRTEFYLVPVGVTVLAFVELLKKELPVSSHDPLRYIGALTILVSPAFQLFSGSWEPILTLMVLSVVVILLAIGLRLRALVYTGSAFLLADMAGLVLRTRADYPFVPWLCGIALGVGVIAFAAFCENHREKVLTRIRLISAELATWR